MEKVSIDGVLGALTSIGILKTDIMRRETVSHYPDRAVSAVCKHSRLEIQTLRNQRRAIIGDCASGQGGYRMSVENLIVDHMEKMDLGVANPVPPPGSAVPEKLI